MPCYHPIPASREITRERAIPGLGEPSAKVRVKLFPGQTHTNIRIPCGRCLGCRSRRASEWAMRAVHEARSHTDNLFATITYDDQHLPKNGELVPRDLSLFLKKLRKAASLGSTHIRGTRLRYIACGEYGETTLRPHYHAILFGLGFNDEHAATTVLKSSPTLSALWGKGSVLYGNVSAASAAYVAGYTTKSIGQVHVDGDGCVKHAPFLRTSTRPGIGALYAARYAADFRSGTIIVDGTPHPVPRYYKKLVGRSAPELLEEADQASYEHNVRRVLRDPLGASPDRLVAGEIIARRKRELTHKPSF